MPPTVAILIVSYNVCGPLRRALASISPSIPTIVVDNASADGTLEMLRAEFPHVVALPQARNMGFAHAVNRAAAHTDAERLLLLNPDAWLPPGALARMVARLDALSASHGAVALGPRQVDADGRLQLAFGPRPSILRELGRRIVQRRLDRPASLAGRATAALIDACTPRARVVGWVAGSALLVRRSAFEAIGGFDAGFFLFFEDIDFCLRLAAAGGTVVYDPTITVGHSRGLSARQAHALAARAYRDSQVRFSRLHQGRIAAALTARWARHRAAAVQP